VRVLVAIAIALLSSCRSEARDQVVIEPDGGAPIAVSVELATTPETRALGLMYRTELGPNHGMLFLFPDEQPLSFWMRNTKIPLDILYVDDDGRIVNVYESTTPFSEEVLPSSRPARFVLEVEGGFCERHGVGPGDLVRLGSLRHRPAT